jgi:pimeloyl-ACP methyl ester carboxylesterase
MEVTLNGARIHYERVGAGMPVVFLHAGVADSRMWEPQAREFSKHFDVICPDMRGFGRSEMPPGRWSPHADVFALVEELNLKPAHIVGCSFGGSTTIDFALDHPERVSKLVIVDGGVSGQMPDERHAALYQEVEAADKVGDHQALNQAEMFLWLDGPYRPRGYVRQALRELFLDMNGGNMNIDWEASPTDRLEPPAIDRLSEMSAPALIIVGDKDLAPVLETADLLASSIKGAHKAVIHDAAHLPNLEHPEEFNRIVLDFLLDR